MENDRSHGDPGDPGGRAAGLTRRHVLCDGGALVQPEDGDDADLVRRAGRERRQAEGRVARRHGHGHRLACGPRGEQRSFARYPSGTGAPRGSRCPSSPFLHPTCGDSRRLTLLRVGVADLEPADGGRGLGPGHRHRGLRQPAQHQAGRRLRTWTKETPSH